MGYTAKNRKETQEVTVIEGEIRVQNGGKILNNGTEVALAGKVALQADSIATDVPTLVQDFNALLAKLKSAGVMNNS